MIAVRWVRLFFIFFIELVKSTWLTLKVVLMRDINVRSAFVAIPLDVQSNAGIVMLAHLISLTPGTTSLHVSDDRKTLYVHMMDMGSGPETSVADIKEGFERSIREVLR